MLEDAHGICSEVMIARQGDIPCNALSMADLAASAVAASLGLFDNAEAALDAALIWDVALAAWLDILDGINAAGIDDDAVAEGSPVFD